MDNEAIDCSWRAYNLSSQKSIRRIGYITVALAAMASVVEFHWMFSLAMLLVGLPLVDVVLSASRFRCTLFWTDTCVGVARGGRVNMYLMCDLRDHSLELSNVSESYEIQRAEKNSLRKDERLWMLRLRFNRPSFRLRLMRFFCLIGSWDEQIVAIGDTTAGAKLQRLLRGGPCSQAPSEPAR
jgi:hypothetical protein